MKKIKIENNFLLLIKSYLKKFPLILTNILDKNIHWACKIIYGIALSMKDTWQCLKWGTLHLMLLKEVSS